MLELSEKTEVASYSNTSLEAKLTQTIRAAIQKIGGSNENDLCKFLPVETGGYMHHFTMRKMKGESPQELISMIQDYVTENNNPKKVTPKPRARRGYKKDQIVLNQSDLDRILHIARMAGDKEMVAKLTPSKSLDQLKKELIASIKKEVVDSQLWTSYIEALQQK